MDDLNLLKHFYLGIPAVCIAIVALGTVQAPAEAMVGNP